jgi:membrane protease subunit HflC
MNRNLLVILAFVVAVLGIVGFGAMFTVQQTEQALLLQFGNPVRVVTKPGLHFKIPMVQNVVYLDNRILALDAPAEEVIAADQKRLVVDSFARFRITNALKFYQTVGNVAVARQRLGSVTNSCLRRVIGTIDLVSAVSGERASLMREIADYVNIEAREFGITIVDVRIKRADLPQANSEAVFRRMQTERTREAKEFRAQGAEAAQRIRADADRQRTILLAEAKRKSEILRGEGDAERTRTFAAAYNRDPEFFALYRSLQAYREALGQGGTTMVLSPDSDFFRYFGDIGGKQTSPR